MKPPQVSKDFPDTFYRVTVKGLCVREGKVLLVHDFTGRSDIDDGPEWELPGGGLDFGESFSDALRREVKEEMNLSVSWVDDRPIYVWSTKHGSGKGMEWYYVLTVIFRFELESLDFTPTQECREIRFFSKENLEENISDLASQIVPLAKVFDSKDFIEDKS